MHPLLFSVDLEEFQPARADRPLVAAPVPDLVRIYLDILEDAGVRATFFVVGDVARKFPEVIRGLVEAGHEVGCHGDRHETLNRLGPSGFVADLRANRAAVEAAGAPPPRGFRAPIFSLTESTSWAFALLAQEAFAYTSSVLPAANPLFGWPEFGTGPRIIDGIREFPITTGRVLGRDLPLFGGTYFRVFPKAIVAPRLGAALQAAPVQCYFHPYDVDAGQPWVMHAGVRGNPVLNSLLFLRRRSLPSRLSWLLRQAREHMTYSDWLLRLS
jgi:polysaccharide deacetylase family protein (PEP-CTERM system associated)